MVSLISTLAPEQIVSDIFNNLAVRRAFQFFESRADEITAEQIRICTIPAPPFGEAARAAYLLEKFREQNLTELCIDDEGNCTGLRAGRSLAPLLVVSAHLDTVFPAGTDCTVRRERGRLLAPGIADDGCGLIALLALLQGLNEAAIETEGSLLFVGTVGEED